MALPAILLGGTAVVTVYEALKSRVSQWWSDDEPSNPSMKTSTLIKVGSIVVIATVGVNTLTKIVKLYKGK